jgi:hypothetical protein
MVIPIAALLAAVITWVALPQIGARQQVSVRCPDDVAVARGIVRVTLGLAWSAVPGSGDDNFKPKLGAGAPVLSVSYQAVADGGCVVDIWCSQFATRYGLIEHGQLVWRTKRVVARALTQAVAGAADQYVPAGGPQVALRQAVAAADFHVGENREFFGGPLMQAKRSAAWVSQPDPTGADRALASAPHDWALASAPQGRTLVSAPRTGPAGGARPHRRGRWR